MIGKITIAIKNWRDWYPCAFLCTVILLYSVFGAIIQENGLTFAMIGFVCLAIVTVATGAIKEKQYPYLIWSIGLALLLQTTLISSGLIGSDIHTEYYFYNQAVVNGSWNFADSHPYNSAAGSTVLAPFLTNVFGISGYWIFKLIFPLMFSIVPVILYFIFKKEFGSKVAFFASVFFVIVPTWSMELIGIPRQMLGEIMLALIFFVVIVAKWKWRIKAPVILALGLLGAVLHYIIGPIILVYLSLGSVFLLFFKRRTLAVKWMVPILALLVVGNVMYYGWVCQGMPLKLLTTGSSVVSNLVVRILPKSLSFMQQHVTIPSYPYPELEESETGYPEGMAEELEKAVIQTAVDNPVDPHWQPETHPLDFIFNTDPTVTAAWGGDFASASPWGKVFRILQYATQVCVLVGCVYLIRNRKKYSAEYLCFSLVSAILLAVCMFLPHFAALINATRFYHIALFMLAPVFVIGGMAIFRNIKVLSLVLIIPYFIFTSGAVFELSGSTDISRIDIPYSIPLSNHRVDMAGVFTANDMKVRDWAVENDLATDTYADTHAQLLLWEKAYTYWRDLRGALKTGEFKTGNYIFLSERNNESQTIILRPETGGSATGRRIAYTYIECGMDKVIENGEIVYRQGDSFILKVKR
jgi:uncharacterized membrane protein